MKIQSRVFTAKCSERQVGISNDIDGGSHVTKFLSLHSRVATPLALIALGGSFSFHSIKEFQKQLIFSVSAKLIIVPAIFIFISIWFGFRNVELVALVSMFISPTAVSTFTMAQNAAANSRLASEIVVFSSLFAVFTSFFWILALKSLEFI